MTKTTFEPVHYIGVRNGLNLHLILTPETPEAAAKWATKWEPLTTGEITYYRVSAEVAMEFEYDEDDES